MDIRLIADIILTISSTCYCIALFPQIIRVHKVKSASQFSWLFLTIISIALIGAIVAKALLGLVGGSIADSIQVIQYFILIGQKAYYEPNKGGLNEPEQARQD